IPYILLIFEILLTDDQQPADVKWKPPASENDAVEEPVVQAKEPTVDAAGRTTLLNAVFDILPRIGKDEATAIAVLRILVILTRDRSVAKTVGDKKNLQRLFLTAKQLCGAGSARLKETRIAGSIMTVLRHVVEDEDSIRQVMRYEIRNWFEPQARNPRPLDVNNYLRGLSHVALRCPALFIEVTNDMVKIAKWTNHSDGAPRNYPLALKQQEPEKVTDNSAANDESVEPTVQATEVLTISDVKPSTEVLDKEMTDTPRTPGSELKRPVLENPDGVIHFLLTELLNYREVEDREPPQAATDVKAASGESVATTDADTPSSPADEPTTVSKDKKPSRIMFKPEEHPIFVYRCFLLHCLAELLQSYTRAKMEFINFKRNAPILSNTPVKPRSSVLNYLLHDLLSQQSLTTAQPDSLAQKKKTATSEQARLVLSALVAKTGEKPTDRNRDRYEYDDEPDLLFVRKFVLDTILRAYKDASVASESFDLRYAKMLSLAELMSHMIGEKEKDGNSRQPESSAARSQGQLKRLMYEKGYLAALTASIADIDLTYPGVKRTVKHILRVLRVLTHTGIHLSQANILPPSPADVGGEDEIASTSSLSEMDDDREETPDLYRNSALGMLEPGREDDFSEDSEDGLLATPPFTALSIAFADTMVDDEEMYDDEYGDDLGYDDEMSEDGEEDVSDEDEELGEMGEIEGLPGDP
ncbi:MAG: hypothetical protein OK454_02640, partial [Thaumarchaeota archaeon]|nr:hypothetical protein [Nitrososphaerota archaeon]